MHKSAVHSAGLIHDVIADNNLDILMLNETWFKDDDPPAIKMDIAPTGFQCHRVCRPGLNQGGGLAIVCRSFLQSRDYPFQSDFRPVSFELQVISINLGGKRTLLVNIYRPPQLNKKKFQEEFAELVDTLATSVGDSFLIAGDLNLPGATPSTTDDNFYELLCQLGLSQHVTSPTKGNNLLDVVLSAGTSIVSDIRILPMVGVSDHSLVAGKIKTLRQFHKFITCTNRNIRSLNRKDFTERLLKSDLFSENITSCNEYANLMQSR